MNSADLCGIEVRLIHAKELDSPGGVRVHNLTIR